MPVYEYEHIGCLRPQCGLPHVFEFEQPITADALTRCIDCDSPVKRLISRTSFTWKNGAPTPKHY